MAIGNDSINPIAMMNEIQQSVLKLSTELGLGLLVVADLISSRGFLAHFVASSGSCWTIASVWPLNCLKLA